MFQNIIIGTMIALAGGALTYYSHYVADFFGSIKRAEEKLGGTKQLVVLFGFIMVFIGLLFVFGVINKDDMGNTEKGFGTSVTDNG